MNWRLLVCILFSTCSAIGQEQFGAAFSNYTPSISVFMNPSSMLDAKTWLDIHIVGAGSYTNNNFVSLNNTNYIRIARTNGEGIDETDLEYHQNRRKYQAYNRTFVNVLSGVWSQGDHAAGLFFNARSFTAVRGIPKFVGQFIENGVPEFTPQHDIDYSIKNIYLSNVNFGEIQLSYAYTFLKKRRDMLMAGISIKKFISFGGAAGNVYNFNFNVRDDSLLSIFELETDAMYTPNPEVYVKGGRGLDLGFTYQKMISSCSNYLPNSKKGGCKRLPYQYMLAASLLDLGAVKFDPDNVQYAGYKFSTYEWFGYANQSINEDSLVQVFQNQDPDHTDGRVNKKERIHLPTTISFQGDYNIWASRFFANGSITQGIPISKTKFGTRRANSLMVGLRFETKIFDIAIPFSLYEYKTPQLGLSVRFYCLTVGTDKLLHLIGRNDLYGGDIYVHLNIPFFNHPKCKTKAKKDRGGSQGSSTPSSLRRKRGNGCDAYN